MGLRGECAAPRLAEFVDNLCHDLLRREGIGKYSLPAGTSVSSALLSGVCNTKVRHLVSNFVAKRSRLG